MGIKIALAGNPNCGKTTLFNALTGANQFVGNWPGVTVEKKEGKLKGNKEVTVTDLPGIYSLSPYTLEEVVARNYLLSEKPDVILNIIDGTNLERNLYLSTQLLELGIPVVMAVNMMDIVAKSGEQIHTDKLGSRLGCDVVARERVFRKPSTGHAPLPGKSGKQRILLRKAWNQPFNPRQINSIKLSRKNRNDSLQSNFWKKTIKSPGSCKTFPMSQS